MNDEIGAAAGQLWQVLNEQGEQTFAQLKKTAKLEAPLFDWAVGWLAREDKLDFAGDKRSLRLRLK